MAATGTTQRELNVRERVGARHGFDDGGDNRFWQTGMTILPGHRLRVEVASADFPIFERNLNTGGNNATETRFLSAKQAIYHDAKHPSHILLPMILEK